MLAIMTVGFATVLGAADIPALFSLDPESFVAWTTAIATGVGTVISVLEVAVRRLYGVLIEQHTKLQATERKQLDALRAAATAHEALVAEKTRLIEELSAEIERLTAAEIEHAARVAELFARLGSNASPAPLPAPPAKKD